MFKILNAQGQVVAERETAYEAACLANAKADVYNAFYYVYNTVTKKTKRYVGFKPYHTRGHYPFGRI